MTPRRATALGPQVAIVLAVCAAVYFTMLGYAGLCNSEGHRAVPGWTMQESGEWGSLVMFERPYFRKPPGLPWLIGASASVFGPTEWSARGVSALASTVMALAALFFARRWFGPRAGLIAGLAQALMPVAWEPGRTAEIEALNNLGAQLACLAWLNLLLAPAVGVAPGAWRRERLAPMLLATLGALIMLLAKGPASIGLALAAMFGAFAVTRTVRAFGSPWLWGSLLLAATAAGAAVSPVAANALRTVGPEPVSESMTRFLWGGEGAGGWGDRLFMPLGALGAAMPVALAMLLPFGGSGRGGSGGGGAAGTGSGVADEEARRNLARACAATWLAWIALLLLSGVTNPRYAMPAASLLPLVVGWALTAEFAGWRRTARHIGTLGRPRHALVALLIAAAVYLPLREASRARNSGREAGLALGALLPDGAEVWADGAIEARPEVLWYARASAAESGRRVRIRWMKPELEAGAIPAPGVFMVLREDGPESERARYAAALGERAVEVHAAWPVGPFRVVLVRVEE